MAAEPLTANQIAARLRVPVGRIYVWAHRYNARKVRRGRTVYYDWHDLKTIERCIRLGEPVPDTPEQRDQLRASVGYPQNGNRAPRADLAAATIGA